MGDRSAEDREQLRRYHSGLYGSTQSGITTTIGRGGSDYTAAIVGSLLDAEDIQIWTDVDGILTADPSIINNAKKIKVMSFNEAAELAYFGARVLHPETILPAVKKDIPVHVLNSRRPESTGTLIIAKPRVNKECVVKSIVYKEGITLISIVSTRIFLRRISSTCSTFSIVRDGRPHRGNFGSECLRHDRQRRDLRLSSRS